MVLPFTVCTSFFILHSRPSLRILLACLLVTMGFFVGVFLDGTEVSVIGVTFGVLSSMITAIHSVVIKRSLDVVKGSALHLSWYTNLYSAVALVPVIIIAGEAPAIGALFAEPGPMSIGISPLTTFLWGSAITVCPSHELALSHHLMTNPGSFRFLDEHRQFVVDQGHLSHHPHGFVCRPGRSSLHVRGLALCGCHHYVSLLSVPSCFSRSDRGRQRTSVLHRDHPWRVGLLHLGQTSRESTVPTVYSYQGWATV